MDDLKIIKEDYESKIDEYTQTNEEKMEKQVNKNF